MRIAKRRARRRKKIRNAPSNRSAHRAVFFTMRNNVLAKKTTFSPPPWRPRRAVEATEREGKRQKDWRKKHAWPKSLRLENSSLSCAVMLARQRVRR